MSFDGFKQTQRVTNIFVSIHGFYYGGNKIQVPTYTSIQQKSVRSSTKLKKGNRRLVPMQAKQH